MSAAVVPLADAADEARFGGKAAALSVALRAGLPVPGGVALSVGLVGALLAGDPAARQAVADAVAALDGPLAVRSSAIGEDGAASSFAGQHLTELNVIGAAAVLDAVGAVGASASAESAVAYRSRVGADALGDEPCCGVVVQRLVAAEVAGVLFTRNPVTGADERVIEASWALGEAVVGGLVTPDCYRVARDGTVLESLRRPQGPRGRRPAGGRHRDGAGRRGEGGARVPRAGGARGSERARGGLRARVRRPGRRGFARPRVGFPRGRARAAAAKARDGVTLVDQAARSRERRLLLSVCLATTLVPLSSTMIAVALPDLREDFGLSVSGAVWMVSAYLIVTAAAQPVAGSLGDRIGRRRLVLGGIVGFGVASLAVAAAPVYAVAVVARCLQAVCGALALVNAAATVRTALPADRRGRSFGLIGMSATLAAASGPPLGSLAVALAGWRGTFLAVLPLVLLALVATSRWLPGDPPRAAAPARRFDLAGALLLLLTLGGAAVLINRLAEGLPLIAAVALGAATVAGGLAFAAVERGHPAPVLDLAVLRVRAVAFAGVAIGAANLAMYLILLAVPLLIEGHDTVSAGALLAPMLFGAALVAPIGGRLSDRLGRRTPALAGNILLAVAMLAMVPVDLHAHAGVTAALLGVAGVGLGLSTAAIQTAGAEALPAAQAGVAAGVSSSCRYLGSILGTSLLALLIHSGTGRPVFAVAAAAAVLSAVAAAGLGRRPASGHVT